MWQWCTADGKAISFPFMSIIDGERHLAKVMNDRNEHNAWAASCLDRWRRYAVIPFTRVLVQVG